MCVLNLNLLFAALFKLLGQLLHFLFLLLPGECGVWHLFRGIFFGWLVSGFGDAFL